ncbi:hypothetical protein [Alkalibacillus silvisoli]|uniref:DUF1361 domain-containing protein n=1 Tax=Alkalibacillus silvisoli TaxID=392823 RepID=A0ABN1A6X5_9BACI
MLYLNLSEIFTNRELAIGFWMIAFIVMILTIRNVRKEIPKIIKAAISGKLLIWYTSMLLYFIVMIIFLFKVGYWELRLLKGTIIWFFVVGVVSSFGAVEKAKDSTYFVNFLKNNFKLLILLQFIVNLYSLPLIWELILVPFIVFIAILTIVLERPGYTGYEYRKTKEILNTTLAIIGIFILFYSIVSLIINWNDIVVEDLIKAILLPILLSFLFVFYMYSFVLYATYEMTFMRLGLKKR